MHERYESVVEKQIREAQERGEFDDLPGKGKPLSGLEDDDELWWVRGYLRREGLSGEDLLPEGLQLRKQLDRLDETVAGLGTEAAVREHVHQLNVQIRRARVAPSGPPVVLRTARADEVVARWRAARPAPAPVPAVPEPVVPGPVVPGPVVPGPTDGPAPRATWWSRLRGRA